MRRRVALLLPRLLGGGGLDRTTMRLAEGLLAHDVAVDVVYVDAAYPYPADPPPGARVIDLGASRAATALPRLVRYLRRERPTALLGAMPVANLLALTARDLARVPTRVVVKEHNTVSVLLDQAPGAKTTLMRAAIRRRYPRADAVVAISGGVADDLAHVSGLDRSRIEVIGNPVITAGFAAGLTRAIEHPWFTPDADRPVVVTVARLATQKDLPTLLAAFGEVRSRRPARLAILGEGPERAALEALVDEAGLTEDVWLPGFVPDPQRYVARAEVFVLSSRYEGLGNVVVEALAAGAPVVSTDCPSGPREILRDGAFGLLVPVGDAAAMASAIERVLDAPPPPVPTVAWAAFTTDAAARRYLDVIDVIDGSA